MDAVTYDAVAGHHPDVERCELELKGKSATIDAYAVRVQ
jgi:hypothetical protein